MRHLREMGHMALFVTLGFLVGKGVTAPGHRLLQNVLCTRQFRDSGAF